MKISLNFKTSYYNLKISGLGAKLWVAFLSFSFWKELWRFKVKDPMHFVEQNINFNKNATESKMKNPTYSFKRRTLYFNSYKNRKLKVKLWWVGARKRKKRAFLYRLFCPKKFFLHLCFISMCSVLNTLSEYTYFPYFFHFYILTSSKTFSVFYFYFMLGVPNVSSILNLKCS